MKFLYALGLAMPAMSAAARITDPEALASIQKRQEKVMDLMARGEYVNVMAPGTNTSLSDADELQASRTPIGFSVIAGLALVSSGNLGYSVLVDIGTQLGEFFFKPDTDTIWTNQEYCRTYFQTQGGGNCEIRTYERGSGDRTATHHPDNGCAWPAAPEGIPDVNAFDDPGVGLYSVFMTATDEHTLSVVEDPYTCETEGICHPQYIFYRDGYEIVLDTWRQKGRVSACQYSGGEDCEGLCFFGVKDQFSTGGNVWGGDCAIPCIDDDSLPDKLRA